MFSSIYVFSRENYKAIHHINDKVIFSRDPETRGLRLLPPFVGLEYTYYVNNGPDKLLNWDITIKFNIVVLIFLDRISEIGANRESEIVI